MPKRAYTKITQLSNDREIEALTIRLAELKKQKVSTKQKATLERWRKEEAESVIEEFLRQVPKGVYCRMANRKNQIIDEFGSRYGIPIVGPTICLHDVIPALHAKISELAAIAKPYEDEEEAGLIQQKLREEITKLKRQSELLTIDIKTKMSELVKRDHVVDRLSWLSGQLQSLGTRLFRVGGEPAQSALNEFLESMAVELDGGSLSV